MNPMLPVKPKIPGCVATTRQGLTVQLEQSPFLSIVPEQAIQQTLRLMGQPADAKLTAEISREVCQRTGSTAVIDGSIAQIGTQYSLILKAVNCLNGESVTSTEAQASDKSHVLEALGRASSDIRKKLGESPATVRKFDTSLERATTPSLEALQAYSLGRKRVFLKADEYAGIPFFKQAIKLDPTFAMAYAMLGAVYGDLGEATLGSENLRKAFELRAGASEREQLYIESRYQLRVSGNLENARRVYEVWVDTYPKDWDPRNSLGNIYYILGRYDRALAEHREALSLYPEGDLIAGNIARDLTGLNRFEEARAIADQQEVKNPDSLNLQIILYNLAFLKNDAAEMKRQVGLAAGKPPVEDFLLEAEADTAAYFGRLEKARTLSRQAVASAERTQNKERAAVYEVGAALREALFGNGAEAQQQVASALRLSSGGIVQCRGALALALLGDAPRVQELYDDLVKRFPEETLVQFKCLPTLNAQLFLGRNEPLRAIETLQAAVPYELGFQSTAAPYPAYVRGLAYLAAHQGSEAVPEFQKIIDHRGIVLNEPIGALARLGLARAYTMQGDTAKAKAAYQDFLTLWKDADPDLPILKAAKAEYARLQ
jgi:tetratricopeptide (TPR) repeat protein